MLKNRFIRILFSTCFILATCSVQSRSAVFQDTLKIGFAGSEPFVFENQNKGIAIEIWNEIAEMNQWNYKLIRYGTIENALDGLKKDGLDGVAGPISITSNRLKNMAFSQPFYSSSISIVSLNNELSWWQKIKPLFSFELMVAICILLLILASVGALLWWVERKASPDQFPEDPIKGIGTGMWLALVTMTTTGYGDKAPVTVKGRVITGVWMVVSLISASSMVAGIASVLTVSSLGKTAIINIEQLSNAATATIPGSPAEDFLSISGINAVPVKTIQEGIKMLKNGEVEAMVYDRPQLLYFLNNNEHDDLYLSKEAYFNQGYGFAFPVNSSLPDAVSFSLLTLTENQLKERIIQYYIKQINQ